MSPAIFPGGDFEQLETALESAEAAFKDGNAPEAAKLLRPILVTTSRLQEQGVATEKFPPQLPRVLEISGAIEFADKNYLAAKNSFEHLALIWELIATQAEASGSTKHVVYAQERADAARASAESAVSHYQKMVGELFLKGAAAVGRGLAKWLQHRRRGKLSGGPHI